MTGHSSITTTSPYHNGSWSVGCSVCHNQHIQPTTKVVGNNGGFIRNKIDLRRIVIEGSDNVKTGLKKVTLLSKTGPNSYAQSDNLGGSGIDSTPNGICQVCHEQTSHWRNNGTKAAVGVHAKYNGDKCMWCHNHSEGFMANFPDHASRINEVAFCLSCHPGPEIVEVTHISECLNCHQPDDYRMQNYLALYQTDPLSVPVQCDECHYGQFNEHVADTGHGKIHDKAILGYDTDDNDINNGYIGCEACHYSDIVQEHSRARGITCSTCHASTAAKVLTAINKGKSPVDGGLDQFVFCDDCHNTTADLPTGNLVDKHHATPYATDGNCTHCHVVGRGIDGPTGGPCGSCHGDSRYGYRHTNAAMLDLDKVNDYRVCFSCHLENAQGYVADPEGDPPGDPGYSGTPVAVPMHALVVEPRYPADLWVSDQCGYATCSGGITNLPPCAGSVDNQAQCDNFKEMAADPVGYIAAHPELTQLQEAAVFELSKKTPGFGLFNYYFPDHFGSQGVSPYFTPYIPDDIIDGTIMDVQPTTAGTTMRYWQGGWLRSQIGNDPFWLKVDQGFSVTVPIFYDAGSGIQQYNVYSPDGTGGGGMTGWSGNISVSIAPQGAIDDGARWRHDGLGWLNSGHSVTGLSTREHFVEFQKIAGWVTPAPLSVTVNAGATAKVTGASSTYIACSETPALSITGPSPTTWSSPHQIETFSASGWHGQNVKWRLATGGASGFRIIPISPTSARVEKTGATIAGSYTFTVSAKGSDCYGNSSSTTVNVTVDAGGAASPLTVTQDGMIGNTAIDSLAISGGPTYLTHVAGDLYATVNGTGIIRTMTVNSAGQISDAFIHELDLTFAGEGSEVTQWYRYQPMIKQVSGDVFVMSMGSELKTVRIDPDPVTGGITLINSLQIYNSTLVTNIYKGPGNTFIVAYGIWGGDYYLRTIEINNTGQMTWKSSAWNFGGHPWGWSRGAMYSVIPIGNSNYAIAYYGESGSTAGISAGYISTFSVGSNGELTNSFIDTYEFGRIETGKLKLFNLTEQGKYGIVHRAVYGNSAVKTIDIDASGIITRRYQNEMLLEQMFSVSGSDVVQVTEDVFAFVNFKNYAGDSVQFGTGMLETYRIQNGIIDSTAIDFLKSGNGAYPEIIHAVGDIYLVSNGWNKIYTFSINSDGDGDGIPSLTDNCPSVANGGQLDTDGDGIGDACDLYPDDPDNDSDGDGEAGNLDGCPSDADNDMDGDGICAGSGYNGSLVGDSDNCPFISNPDQVDTELDGVGDVCDNCPNDSNKDQSDVDHDGVGDVCDDNADNDAILDDGDNNGIKGDNPCSGGLTSNCDDNCPLVVNDSQVDLDADTIGDACDGVISTSPFTYRRLISLFPATPLADYQIKVSLTPTNFDYTRVKADGSDIRIYDDAENELSHWVENWTPGGTSVIWVKVPAAGTNQISLAYGYEAALSASNGDATFLFFDDFAVSSLNLTKWPQHRGEVIAGSIATLDVYSSYAGPEDFIYASNYTVPIDSIVELKHKTASSTTTSRFGITDQRTTFNQDNINYFGIQLYGDTSPWNQGLLIFGTNNGGIATNIQSSVNDYTWHILKLIWSTDLAELYIDDVLKLRQTTNVPTAADTLHPLLRDLSSTDWIRIRKNAPTEPVVIVGNEL